MEEANCSEFVKSLFPFQFIPQPPASYSSPKPKLRARSCPSSLCKAQVWENVQCTLYIYVRGLKQLLHPMGPRLPLYPTPVWILRRLDTRRYKEHTFCNFIAIQMSFLTSIWQGLLSVINCYTSDMFCTFNPYKNLSIVVGLPYTARPKVGIPKQTKILQIWSDIRQYSFSMYKYRIRKAAFGYSIATVLNFLLQFWKQWKADGDFGKNSIFGL